jgi:hypothetical protein
MAGGNFRFAYIAKLLGSVACVAVGGLCSTAGFFGLYTHSMGIQRGTIAEGTVPSDTNLFLAVLGLLAFQLGYFFLMKQVRRHFSALLVLLRARSVNETAHTISPSTSLPRRASALRYNGGELRPAPSALCEER